MSKVVLDTFVIVHPDDPGKNNRDRLLGEVGGDLVMNETRVRRGLYRVIIERVPDSQSSQFPAYEGDRDE